MQDERMIKEVISGAIATIARVTGEITLDRSPTLHKELIAVCTPPPEYLIIDMSQVPHIDSAGIGTLVDILRRMREAGKRMALIALCARVRSMFEVTKLDQFFSIYDSEHEALGE